MNIEPKYYTRSDGGSFKQWSAGSFDDKNLDARDPKDVEINDTKVHSFTFENPAAGYGNFARWDCVNGWTTTVEEAKERNPNLLNSYQAGEYWRFRS